jgi:hypothetical protein
MTPDKCNEFIVEEYIHYANLSKYLCKQEEKPYIDIYDNYMLGTRDSQCHDRTPSYDSDKSMV